MKFKFIFIPSLAYSMLILINSVNLTSVIAANTTSPSYFSLNAPEGNLSITAAPINFGSVDLASLLLKPEYNQHFIIANTDSNLKEGITIADSRLQRPSSADHIITVKQSKGWYYDGDSPSDSAYFSALEMPINIGPPTINFPITDTYKFNPNITSRGIQIINYSFSAWGIDANETGIPDNLWYLHIPSHSQKTIKPGALTSEVTWSISDEPSAES
ncbi:hypothetical protein H9L19_03295 [Weissella diestrammenae]|uniref:WxL domain-containing protein n=1 Tax=Weissella diestrammenae TaxID=1162633 RepID=A0A7G9T723_9LACO|nr:hypothetical protein [Weissella diestrammenae]MCM0582505.1 hypothetical protein [Weissella diestrammenae]QNN75898.1 hypothetical protein H9L19_03295 [Weissella diestrammenae]